MSGALRALIGRVRRGWLLVCVAVGCLAGATGAYVALASSLNLGTCTDNFTGSTGGDWATASNWTSPSDSSVHQVPTSSDVACWPSGTTVVVSTGSQNADSVQGGSLTISGGGLTLDSSVDDSSLSGLKITNGALNGASGRTLQLDGDFDWDAVSGGVSGFNNDGGSGILLAQSAGHSFTIEGSAPEYFAGGSMSTPNPVTISDLEFWPSGTSSLSATGSGNTITFETPGTYSGDDLTMNADGIVTESGAVNLPYTVHLTGSASSLAGDLALAALNTDAGTTLTVPSGHSLSVAGGQISGTVTGHGTFVQTNGTTTVAGGATLSTDNVSVTGGTLSGGGTYSASTATTISGGALQLNTGGSTGNLTLVGGDLSGSGGQTLSINGNFDWDATSTWSGINYSPSGALTLSQASGHSFKVEGSQSEYFEGGTITTPNPVSISNTNFTGYGNAILSATGTGNTVAFTSAGTYGGNSLTINADGITTSGGAISIPYTVHLTGSSSSLATDLSVGTLNTDPSSAVTVPASRQLSVGGGQISGTVTGQGTFMQAAGTTSLPGGATLSTDNVSVTGGQLSDNGSYSADSATSISGGALQLNTGGTTGNLTLTGGDLSGSGGQTLSVNGNFDLDATNTWAGINYSPSGALTLSQAPGQSFKIEGSQSEYFEGGTITTPNPVTISNLNFSPTGSSTLSATGSGNTVAFTSAGTYSGNTLTINADGITTSGGAISIPYTVHLTGSSSSLATDLSVGVLNLDSGAVLSVPAGDHLSPGNATINGTVSGAGSYVQTGGTTTVTGTGSLSTASVSVSGGQVIDSGGYASSAGTSLSGGTLQLNTGGSTGNLSILGGNLTGSGGQTFTINGNFDWNSTSTSSGINYNPSGALALLQTGSGSFKIEGSQSEYFYGGSMSTPNPVSINNPNFTPAGTPSLSSGGAVSFGTSGTYAGNSLTLSGSGFAAPAGTTTVPYTLDQTGGTTDLAAGTTLGATQLNLSGGTAEVDGTLAGPADLTGGTLTGTGTIGGKLTNDAGTVAPGDSPGTLTLGSGYQQGPGGTLAVAVDGTSAGDYAKLGVTGNVSLDGTLALEPSSSYAAAAQPGDTIGFLTYSGSLTGRFASTTVSPPLANSESFTPDYSTANVIHAVVGNGTPDTTAPVSSASSPTNARTVSIPVQYTVSDQGGSGLASLQLWAKGPSDPSYVLVQTVSNPPASGSIDYSAGEGDGNYAFYTVAKDNAGNTETKDSADSTTELDTAAPQVTILTPSDGSQYTQGTSVTANYGCTDPNGSGIATCSGPVANGGLVDTSSLGTHSFTVNASDNAGNTTSRTVDYTVVGAATGPSATTGGVHDLTATGVTLLGIVNPNGAATNYWFQYGTDQTYGQTTPTEAAGTQNSYSAAADVSGLQPSTLYHYRLVAQQGTGSPVYGADQTFTTPVLPAPTNTQPPLISGTAQVNQTLTALPGDWTGNPTSYGYQWFACDSGGANCQKITTAGTGQHFDVTNNQLGDTIRVQVTASNGTTSAPAQSDATDPVVAPASTDGGGGTTDSVPPSSTASSPSYANATFTVSYVASDPSPSSGLASVELYVKGPSDQYFERAQTDSAPPANGQGSFSYTPTEGDGEYAFYTRAVDGAGNQEAEKSSPDSITVVDTTPPTSKVTAPSPYSNTRALTLNYTASDGAEGSGVTQIELFVKGPGDTTYSPAATQSIPASSGSFTYTAAGDGSYSFYTRATDAAGNTEAAKSTPDASVIVDTVAPTAIAFPPSGQSTNSTTNATAFTVLFSASDSGSELKQVQLSMKGPKDSSYSVIGTVAGPSGQYAQSSIQNQTAVEDGLGGEGDGLYSFYATATDWAGNTSAVPSSPQMTVLVDTTAPTITITAPSGNAVYSQGQVVDAAYSCSDGSGTGVSECSGAVNTSGLVSSGSPIDTSSAGSHTFSVTAKDKAGNVGQTVLTYTVRPNTPAAPTGLTAVPASTSEIDLSWSAAAGAASYTVWRAPSSGGPYTQVGSSSATSFADTGLSPSTTYYYYVRAVNTTGSSGNSNQASAATQAAPACSGGAAADSTGAPLRAHALGGAPPTYYYTVAVDGVNLVTATQFSGPSTGDVVTESQSIGTAGNEQATGNQQPSFTLSVPNSCSNTSAIQKLATWAQQAAAGASGSRKNMTVTEVENTGTQVEQWQFTNAWPTAITSCALSASQNQVCDNKYTFVYEAFAIQQPSAPSSSSSTATVSNGSTVIPLTCNLDKPCTGNVKLELATGLAGDAQVAKALKLLGTQKYRIKAHHKARLTIRLNAYGRKLLSHSKNHKLTAELIIHAAGTPAWAVTAHRIELVARGRNRP